MDRPDARDQTATQERDERAAARIQSSAARKALATKAKAIRKADRATRVASAKSPPRDRVRPRHSEDAPAIGVEIHRGAKAGKARTSTAQAAHERCVQGPLCIGMWSCVAKPRVLVGARMVMKGMWWLIVCGMALGKVEVGGDMVIFV